MTPRLTREQLHRQVAQHLAALHGAGAAWLPKAAEKVTLTEHALPDDPAMNASLFDDPTAAAGDPEVRRTELEVLRETVAGCPRCGELAATRTQTVFGVGPIGPDLCLVGEAPGADEDRLGEPFVGAAGQLLNKILTACGFQREDVYICNTLKCRPPGNRPPKPEEMRNCREWFDHQLALVRPKFICALGGSAAQNLLGVSTPIGKLRGKVHRYGETPVVVTYHPAFLLPHRSPDKKKDVWEDMKFLLRTMGRPIPGGK